MLALTLYRLALAAVVWIPGFAASAAGEPGPGYTWKSCERHDLGGVTIPFDKQGKFIPACAPDTLYSWADRERVLDLAAKSTPGDLLPARRIYAWRTPLGTFGYGDTLIRIKLKAGVKFALISEFDRSCDKLEGAEDTVFVAPLAGMFPERGSLAASDYLICSSGMVESWSHGRPETFEEMRREALWAAGHGTKDFDRYSKASLETGEDCVLRAIPMDGTNTTLPTLLRNFAEIEQAIAKKEGRIFYAPGVKPSPARHFSTRLPGYFNPNPSSEKPFSRDNGAGRR